MEPKRILLVFGASLALCSSLVGAQTIYKQVDEEGRVSFTDQPRANARTLASYETGRTAARLDSRAEPESGLVPVMRDTGRREAPGPRITEIREYEAPRPGEWEPRVAEGAYRTEGTYGSSVVTEAAPAIQRVRGGDVERAIATNTQVVSPMAMQADANEAARRSRMESSKREAAAAASVLKVQPLAPDHVKLDQQKNLQFFHALWVLTFLLMAGGLLYFGWRVLELILGRAFPTWHIGAG